MKLFQIAFAFIIAVATCELHVPQRPLVFPGWPPKSGKQNGIGRNHGGKRTLVLQIRSDKHVPIVLKRPPHQQALVQRPGRPHKLILKSLPQLNNKLVGRKPTSVVKIKLPSVKPAHFEKPYHYEQPYQLVSEVQKLPFEENPHFISDHFAPIHTIPAPNLSIQDNHIYQPEQYLPPQPQQYHANQYQVNEEQTNDQTILDPFSGKQKFFAPDPDPSLPTAKIRPATEPYNTPSNGKPLPADIQSNYLAPQALVSSTQQQIPELYGVQYVGQPIQVGPAGVQNPTFLVTQSNQLFHQHQHELFQQHQPDLFRSADNVIGSSYADADLTQQVASNGQILQALKDAGNVNPEYTAADAAIHAAPQFAALIAAPPASTGHAVQIEQRAPFHLTNVAAPQQNGFVVSNFFGNAHADSQLLQAFAEEEAQREQVEGQQQAQINYENQIQLEQQEQQLLLQQQQNHQLELQQQQQQYEIHQQQHQLHQQQQQQHQQHKQQQQELAAQNAHPQLDPAQAAFEEHSRLVQQQLGPQSLRIFVPDDEGGFTPDGRQKLKKRSDERSVGSKTAKDRAFSVSSSVEVSSEDRMQ